MPQTSDDGETVISEQFGGLENGCFSIRDEENGRAWLEMQPHGVILSSWE